MRADVQDFGQIPAARAHNAMADEYDDIQDYWYSWLFACIHEFLSDLLREVPAGTPLRALDVGCGTGFQSFLLAQAGYEVDGFDIAVDLLDRAKAKIAAHAVSPLEAPPLQSPGPWTGATRASRRLAARLERLRGGRTIVAPRFFAADATQFDYPSGEYDVVVSCGSVLSFIDPWRQVFDGMVRSLKPGGILVIEVEQKVNLDLVWPIVDRMVFGRLGYEQDWREIFRNLLGSPGRSVRVDYPFELHDGGEVALPIRLFSIRELQQAFRSAGLEILDRKGIHWASNLLPSPLLHAVPPGCLTRVLAGPLLTADRLFGRCWPAWRLGCSLLVGLRKPASPVGGTS